MIKEALSKGELEIHNIISNNREEQTRHVRTVSF